MAPATFTGLPLELKQEILKYVLVVDKHLYMKPPVLQYPVRATFPGEKSGLHARIITASKTFAVEGLTMLYGENVFWFKTVNTLCAFTVSISRYSAEEPFNNCHRVKHICLSVGDDMLEYLKTEYFATHFPNLETVELNRWFVGEEDSPVQYSIMNYWVDRMTEELHKGTKVKVKVVSFQK
ncbi:hypothetical protein MMC34_002449 [Xylographa carneopallida]|nr:hypothetical protein [Xylographa carneopallida]